MKHVMNPVFSGHSAPSCKKRWLSLIIILLALSLLASACTSDAPSDEVTQQELTQWSETVEQLEAALEAKDQELNILSQTLAGKESELVELNENLQEMTMALESATTPATTPAPSPSPTAPPPATTAALLNTAMTVAQLLADEDMAGVSNHAHPTLGVRFTPYPYVNTATDVVLTAAQVATAWTTPTQIVWGAQDGTGDPILLSYADYHARYVYDQDYVNPHVLGIDTIIGTGNALDNLPAVYTTARFIDFHFNGFDPQYGGMDWRSLRLVFELSGNDWYLVGIVHGEWTI